MNSTLLGLLTKQILAALPSEKRELYQFIEHAEEKLAQKAKSKDQFIYLLVRHSPYKQAAEHFCMTYDQTARLMQEIEHEVNTKLESQIRNIKWVDYTKKMNVENTYFFLFKQ
ncbi:hypothetical protein [Peribacillus frigoritolerans]|uniref:hypothetical protein n=1 Tax=Peribacillus frigoritolerans TaxID=450367 RepID=UPI001059A5A5|nr:hypothetical protein [Peribacillus frigoritolerans]TDL80270.1 hypothetical protein E2R53_09560 [Peribacillus frigoritolerans]